MGSFQIVNTKTVNRSGMDRFNLRGILRENIRQRIPEDGRVFVATGGVDSISLVASCIDAGYTPIIASFTLDDRESTDFIKAREAAKFFGVEFAPILLPTNRDFIAKSSLFDRISGEARRDRFSQRVWRGLLFLFNKADYDFFE